MWSQCTMEYVKCQKCLYEPSYVHQIQYPVELEGACDSRIYEEVVRAKGF